MKNIIVKLYFDGSIHFGNGVLESSSDNLCSDSIFSAICCEYAKSNNTDAINELVDNVRKNKIKISDAFPFCGETFYLPKPFVRIESQNNNDASNKKTIKKLRFIPAEMFQEYIDGKMNIDQCKDILNDISTIGRSGLNEKVCIAVEQDDPKPYYVGDYKFNEGRGLWFIISADDETYTEELTDVITSLGLSGIGGKRSSGYGRFKPIFMNAPDFLNDSLNKESQRYITLSVCLPKSDELSDVISHADFSVIKRSGFVYSLDAQSNAIKKDDMYLMGAGSCFDRKFCGDVYECSSISKYPVYRYAKPMFFSIGR